MADNTSGSTWSKKFAAGDKCFSFAGTCLTIGVCFLFFHVQKQFKTLVLAFQTDQDTLNRRLEIQVS